MAVYTILSDADFIDILKRFKLGEFISAEPIISGVENTNYFLNTSTGRFIITLYEKRVADSDLPFFLNLMQHLSIKSIPCPLPVADNTGALTFKVKNKNAAITSFLHGKSVKTPSIKQCRSLGAMLARLHLAATDFGLKRENNMGVNNWQQIWSDLSSDCEKWREGSSEILNPLIDNLIKNWPDKLPRGIIHADLFPDNVFFIDDSISGVIDFYFACEDILAYDIAICLNAWCFENNKEFNHSRAMNLLAGYQSVRPLETQEKESMQSLCCGAALRFFLSRLHDWINHDSSALVQPKDPAEYLSKLEFHRQSGSSAAYGLV